MRVAIEDKRTKASPTINKLITHFEMSNLADGKSESTIIWYRDMRWTPLLGQDKGCIKSGYRYPQGV